MSTHPSASQGTPAGILTQPSLSRKGYLLALTNINPSDDLGASQFHTCNPLRKRLEATRSQCTTSDLPKVIFTFSHILLPPFALSCWNNGVFRVEKKKICFRLQSKEVMGKKILCASNPGSMSMLVQSSPSCATPAGSASSACSPQ